MKREVILITIVMFMTTTINNMAHPVTPKLVESLGLTPFMLGAIFAAMSFSSFVMSPVWGRLSDKYGRKRYLLMAPIGYGLAQIGFGFSEQAWQVIIFRILAGGIASASFVCALAYIVDVTTKEERSKAMAFYTAITGFGMTLGYLLGGLIGNKDYHIAFVAQAILSILSVVVITILIKDNEIHKVQNRKQINVIKTLKQYRGTGLMLVLTIMLFTSMASVGFNTAFSTYMNFKLHFSSLIIGIVMAITGLIGLIINVFIFPVIHKKYKDINVLYFSLIIMILTLFSSTIIVNNNINLVIPLLAIFFAFYALYRPVQQAIISKFSHNNNGEVMGLSNSSNALGMISGSLCAGAAYEKFETLPFYISTGIFLLASVLVYKYIIVITRRVDTNEGSTKKGIH